MDRFGSLQEVPREPRSDYILKKLDAKGNVTRAAELLLAWNAVTSTGAVVIAENLGIFEKFALCNALLRTPRAIKIIPPSRLWPRG